MYAAAILRIAGLPMKFSAGFVNDRIERNQAIAIVALTFGIAHHRYDVMIATSCGAHDMRILFRHHGDLGAIFRNVASRDFAHHKSAVVTHTVDIDFARAEQANGESTSGYAKDRHFIGQLKMWELYR